MPVRGLKIAMNVADQVGSAVARLQLAGHRFEEVATSTWVANIEERFGRRLPPAFRCAPTFVQRHLRSRFLICSMRIRKARCERMAREMCAPDRPTLLQRMRFPLAILATLPDTNEFWGSTPRRSGFTWTFSGKGRRGKADFSAEFRGLRTNAEVPGSSDGGGGGNRTRVRKHYATRSTCLAVFLYLAARYPTGREDVKPAAARFSKSAWSTPNSRACERVLRFWMHKHTPGEG